MDGKKHERKPSSRSLLWPSEALDRPLKRTYLRYFIQVLPKSDHTFGQEPIKSSEKHPKTQTLFTWSVNFPINYLISSLISIDLISSFYFFFKVTILEILSHIIFLFPLDATKDSEQQARSSCPHCYEHNG